jgi:hypothetical protein
MKTYEIINLIESGKDFDDWTNDEKKAYKKWSKGRCDICGELEQTCNCDHNQKRLYQYFT